MDEQHNPNEPPKQAEELAQTLPEQNVPTEDGADVSSEQAAVQPTFVLSQEPAVKPAVAPQKPKKSPKKLMLICLTIILLLVAAGAAFWLLTQKDEPTSKTKPNAKTEQTSVESDDPVLQKFIKPTTGEVWYSEPKEVKDLGFYKEAPTEAGPFYYEAGTHGDKTIIMTVVQELGDNIQLFERTKGGEVIFIEEPDSQAVYNEQSTSYTIDLLKSTVQVDKTSHYDSLSIPTKLSIDSKYVITKQQYPSLGELVTKAQDVEGQKLTQTTVKKLGGSSIQKTERHYVDTNLTSIGYSIIMPLGTEVRMDYEPLDVTLDKYQWKTGFPVTGSMQGITKGCGRSSAAVTRADGVKDADATYVGQSSDGQKVYAFTDESHTLITKAYEEFKDFAGGDATVPYSNYTRAEFIKEHGLVLYKDSAGQWLLYVRTDLAPAFGCAKPVVYLYPERTQPVQVKVGADVKVSDPLYTPGTGWNVIAQPNGTLTHNGVRYGSLFWEGPGIGAYPAITSGTVVKRADALKTVRAQLQQQGLNQTEINDFVTYWQDKLPNKPYVRLTWLTTAEMNELAPLYITPKPDTVIRVFLDFSGLDKPIQIPAQKLKAIPRSGFTVVEWGGLSPHKLY